MTDDVTEFFRPISVDSLEKGENLFEISAEPNEKAGLADRLGLPEISDLKAEIRLYPKKGGREVVFQGTIKAEVTQTCVVTLEPFTSSIGAEFDVLYADDPNHGIDRGPEGVDLDLEEGDLPEMITEGVIDIGEAVAQQLSLELDPFPKAPGVEFQADQGVFEAEVSSDSPGEQGDNPFAALAALKDKLK